MRAGTGSYGNGAAMRIAPVALFCHNKSEEQLIEYVRQSATPTHTHPHGVNGAILQALAVRAAFHAGEQDGPMDVQTYLPALESSIKNVERTAANA